MTYRFAELAKRDHSEQLTDHDFSFDELFADRKTRHRGYQAASRYLAPPNMRPIVNDPVLLHEARREPFGGDPFIRCTELPTWTTMGITTANYWVRS